MSVKGNDEERLSLLQRLKEFLKNLRERVKDVFTPRFSLLAEELQDSINTLEFNQDVSMEMLDKIAERIHEVEKFMGTLSVEADKVGTDMMNFLHRNPEEKDGRHTYQAEFEYNGAKNIVLLDAWTYEKTVDEDGNFSMDLFKELMEERKQYFPDVKPDDWFRVYQMGTVDPNEPEKMLHKVEDTKFEDLAFIVNETAKVGYKEIPGNYTYDECYDLVKNIIKETDGIYFDKAKTVMDTLCQTYDNIGQSKESVQADREVEGIDR